MAQESPIRTLEIADDHQIAAGDLSLESANASPSRLNAGAPEFVPRVGPPPPPRNAGHHQRTTRVHHGSPHTAPAIQHHAFHSTPQFASPPPSHGFLDAEFESAQSTGDLDPAQQEREREGLSDEIAHRITKQVEYYFSDVNLATTEHLIKFICKDPEGYVPISVIASFKKIKALANNNSLLADALRTSSKLIVSDDGKKVRRRRPFTESDVEELQSRVIVAENLPEDHCYQNLMKIFSAVGSVKNIRTCYPQTPNGTSHATNRSTKMDMLFSNKVHAFVEYENIVDAEKAVTELNDGRNWRSGLRVRLLLKCVTKHGANKGEKVGFEGDGEDDETSMGNLPNEHTADPSQLTEAFGHTGDEVLIDKESGGRRGRGRGRGVRGRGRLQYHNNNQRSGGHVVGTPPSGHQIHADQPVISKQPPGPRMPDGTRGFTMGRGKPLISSSTG